MSVFEKIRNLSFTIQVVFIVVVTLVVVIYFGGEKLKKYENDYLVAEIRLQTERVFEVFVASNIDSIIAEDVPLLETAIDAVVNIHPDIVLLQIENEDNKKLIKWGREGSELNENKIEISKEIIFEGETFGSVTIEISMVSRHHAVTNHISTIYNLTVMLLALLMVFLALITYFMITRPINLINVRLLDYLQGEDDRRTYRFYSWEFNLLNSTIDQLRDVTSGRDRLQYEVEEGKEIQSELENEKLIAEQANQAKTNFLSFMTHEIRTPLTAILGFSETLLDYKQTMKERVDAINIIINSGNHLLQLINNVLDISKIEAGKLETELIDVDLTSLLKDVVSIVSALTKNKGIEFKISSKGQIPGKIISDPLRLRQILINVISNAVKFTEEGSVTLNINCNRDAEVIIFQVIDTGVGMTQEQKENIFCAFGQADMSTARRFGGTGLGLYLSNILAQKLGDGIYVESNIGEGTSFSVSISTGKIEQLYELEDLDLQDFNRGYVETIDENLSGHVLLADDVTENQSLISHYVKSMGADIDIASNGLEAMEMALSNEYDLVLMDIQMPVLDGLSAVKKLREKGYQVPIVSLSANNMAEEVKEYLSAGCNDAAAKPIDRSVFKQLMLKYLKSNKQEEIEQNAVYSELLKEEPGLIALVNQFLERLPILIEELDQSFESRDWDKLKDLLHNIKGVAGNYGYEELMLLAAKGEFVVTSTDTAAFNELLNKIKAMASRILEATYD